VFVPDPWTWESWMFDRLREAGCDVRMGRAADDPDAQPLTAAEMAAALADADGLLVHSRESVTAPALRDAARLRVIAKMGIGVEKIDVSAATAAGILVTNTPVPENFRGLAEATVALLLALLKRLPQKQAQLREGSWRDRTTEGELVEGKTIGLLGLGRVGSTVAQLLSGWSVRLIAHDPGVGEDVIRRLGVEPVTFDTLLQEADVLSLHAALPAGSAPLIDAAALSRMRRGAYLINTARGLLVDEPALVEALRTGALAGAALDVFSHEPLPTDHPLRALPGVILTPHSIGTSRASQRAICQTAVDCCLDALAGRVPRHVVNPGAVPLWRERVAALSAPPGDTPAALPSGASGE
jgi:phosphoglycerate dehydrogenase-like enzyme